MTIVTDVAPLNLDIYVCKGSELEKSDIFKIEKKNAAINHIEILCFGDFRGTGRAPGAPPPPP